MSGILGRPESAKLQHKFQVNDSVIADGKPARVVGVKINNVRVMFDFGDLAWFHYSDLSRPKEDG